MLTRWPLAVVSIAALLSSILSGHTLYTTYRWSRLSSDLSQNIFNVIIMILMVPILLLIIMMMKLMVIHRRPSVVMSTEVSDSLRWGDTRHSKSIKTTTIVIWLKMPKIIFGKARWRCRRVCVIFQAGCANFLFLCGQSMLQTLAIANWALALV